VTPDEALPVAAAAVPGPAPNNAKIRNNTNSLAGRVPSLFGKHLIIVIPLLSLRSGTKR
jgi:hypothetical protein